ncbi:MAG: hypothetical protein IJS14_14925 [Lentisphaeria bacterium]|nr:hypothetical protein [Lentisphaeria bacterium]
MKIHALFLLLAAGMFSLHAALPEGSQVIQAESLKTDNDAWKVKKHFSGWYGGRPSGNSFLAGPSKKQGQAAEKLTLPKAGKYHLWLRYLDLEKFRGTFILTVRQGGKVLTEQEFDRESVRKKGDGFAKFVWGKLAFEAEAGEAEVSVKKGSVHKTTGNGSRHLDVFILTDDLKYSPDIKDLYPLYVKIRMLPEQPNPAAVHVFGRRSMTPAYTPHMNINAKGLFEGADKGAGNMKNAWLKPGESSPWVDFGKYLSFRANDRINFYTLTSYFRRDQKEAAFEVILSRKPDDSGIFKRFARKGKGCGITLLFNLADDKFTGDVEESKLSLARAEKTQSAGENPVLFPFQTGLALSPQQAAPEVLKNETAALRLIGINGLSQDNAYFLKEFPYAFASDFIFHLVKNKCLNCPDTAKLDKAFSGLGKRKLTRINLMDEPELKIDHVAKCPHCAAGFAAFLQANQAPVTAEKPVFDKKDPQLYYWSMRYRNHIMTKLLKAGSDAVHKYAPELPTMVNFATEVVSGNLVSRGCDWFEVFGSGALTLGWHEDWANTTGTYQVVGFQSNAMRAACRKAGVPFGIYNILARTPWEIEAKGFAAIGHGNKAMHFFNYGPYYANTSDANSDRPEVYQAIRNVTGKTAAAEKLLMSGKVARGEAAILLSVTSDIWNTGTDQSFGKERVYLHLLLQQCGYRPDILSEDDLADELKNYQVLFVTDSHLRRSQLGPLLDWVKAGGKLYLAAGALMFDEYNRPLDLGIERGTYEKISKIGRGEWDFGKLKRGGMVDGMPVVGGMEKPFKAASKLGQGEVVRFGFFPGISYQSESKRPDPKKHSTRTYPEAHRKFIASLGLPVKPRLTTDHFLVEADLIEAPEGQVIVLSNWTGEPRDVKVTLDGKEHAVSALGAGGYIVITKGN